jgi:hypothetical protein
LCIQQFAEDRLTRRPMVRLEIDLPIACLCHPWVSGAKRPQKASSDNFDCNLSGNFHLRSAGWELFRRLLIQEINLTLSVAYSAVTDQI